MNPTPLPLEDANVFQVAVETPIQLDEPLPDELGERYFGHPFRRVKDDVVVGQEFAAGVDRTQGEHPRPPTPAPP